MPECIGHSSKKCKSRRMLGTGFLPPTGQGFPITAPPGQGIVQSCPQSCHIVQKFGNRIFWCKCRFLYAYPPHRHIKLGAVQSGSTYPIALPSFHCQLIIKNNILHFIYHVYICQKKVKKKLHSYIKFFNKHDTRFICVSCRFYGPTPV